LVEVSIDRVFCAKLVFFKWFLPKSLVVLANCCLNELSTFNAGGRMCFLGSCLVTSLSEAKYVFGIFSKLA
jgi:hypothetical protein